MGDLKLAFVSCVSQWQVFEARLLKSPCLQAGGWPLSAYFNCNSAADAFNATLAAGAGEADWLVWVHQDVYLPPGWDTRFLKAIATAQDNRDNVAVAGVYGVVGAGATQQRAGHVLDRGTRLQEPLQLPCVVDSLDELLFAVKVESGLRLDPELGFDFYATDVVLQAKHAGLQSIVVDAYCEHWSTTPRSGLVPYGLIERVKKSAAVFERKWERCMPISTPCFDIEAVGDAALFISTHFSHASPTLLNSNVVADHLTHE